YPGLAPILRTILSFGTLPADARSGSRSSPLGQAEIQKAAPTSPASNTLDRAYLSPLSGVVRPLADGGAAWLHDGSCMSREAHVQFCERLGVRLPGATHRNIYVGSERAGERVKRSITDFITGRLKLKVNEQKSAVARSAERKFLGFSFTNAREPKRRIAPKAVVRFKQKVRELTGRTRGISLERMMKELASYLRGWQGYFGFCETPSVLQALDQWIRRRLRSVIWKQWKCG